MLREEAHLPMLPRGRYEVSAGGIVIEVWAPLTTAPATLIVR
jgi:hypothetical protein